MPNYCYYQMKVVGAKEKVDEFIKVMDSHYDYGANEFEFDRHMGGRVFEVNVDEFEEIDNNVYAAIISGDCAWSVVCCMFSGTLTYYNDLKSRFPETCRSTTVPIESKNLDLDIEIFSEECGMGFQEHYLVRKGVVEIEDCVDYYEYYVEECETKEEAEEEFDTEITDEEWARGCNEGSFYRGGLEWNFQI